MQRWISAAPRSTKPLGVSNDAVEGRRWRWGSDDDCGTGGSSAGSSWASGEHPGRVGSAPVGHRYPGVHRGGREVLPEHHVGTLRDGLRRRHGRANWLLEHHAQQQQSTRRAHLVERQLPVGSRDGPAGAGDRGHLLFSGPSCWSATRSISVAATPPAFSNLPMMSRKHLTSAGASSLTSTATLSKAERRDVLGEFASLRILA